MARQFNLPPKQRRFNTVIRDMYGWPVLELSFDTGRTVDPNGFSFEFQNSTSIQLVCGTIWNPGMMTGKSPMLLAVCSFCRYPIRDWKWFIPWTPLATHGLCSQQAGVNCVDCGSFVCPLHKRWTSDGSWRCLSCARRFWRRERWMSLFYRSEGW